MQTEDRSVPGEFRFGLSTAGFNGTRVVAVRGELDLQTVPELSRTLARLLETVRGIRANGGAIMVSCKDLSIREVFAITGADRVVPIHASLEEAVRQALERTLGRTHGGTPRIALQTCMDQP